MNNFFKWAYRKRGETVIKLGREGMGSMSPEKVWINFTSHNPVFISHGPKGLNGSVKGIGFAPRPEFMEAALKDYVEHIKTYDPADKMYSQRGLDILIKHLYSEEAEKNIDFSCVYGVEMAFKNSFANYKENPDCSMVFYQPPVISYELKGKMEIVGKNYAKDDKVDPYSLEFLQQFVNAQHDVYHTPNIDRWKTRPVYKFTIEEIWDKSAGPKGAFGERIQ